MSKKIFFFLCTIALYLTNIFVQSLLLNAPIIAYADLNPNLICDLIYNPDKTISIDASNACNGYIQIRYSGNSPIVKVIISNGDNKSYPYWISNNNEFETLILGFGDGNYEISVLEQAASGDYSLIFVKTISVALSDALAPFLHANFFVDYTAESVVVKKASSLYASSANDKKFIEDVYHFVTGISFDYEKSLLISANNYPYRTNCDEILALEKGINLDYSTIMTAMLRSQGIPAKLESGYIGETYYSWVNVYISDSNGKSGHWEIYDPTLGAKLNDTIMKELTGHSDMYVALHVN